MSSAGGPMLDTSRYCLRSTAVLSRSSTDHTALSEYSESHSLTHVLRLGTAALRPGHGG